MDVEQYLVQKSYFRVKWFENDKQTLWNVYYK